MYIINFILVRCLQCRRKQALQHAGVEITECGTGGADTAAEVNGSLAQLRKYARVEFFNTECDRACEDIHVDVLFQGGASQRELLDGPVLLERSGDKKSVRSADLPRQLEVGAMVS